MCRLVVVYVSNTYILSYFVDQDDEGRNAEGGQHDEGAVEDAHMEPARHVRTQARKYLWKVQDNDFDGDLPPFLGLF